MILIYFLKTVRSISQRKKKQQHVEFINLYFYSHTVFFVYLHNTYKLNQLNFFSHCLKSKHIERTKSLLTVTLTRKLQVVFKSRLFVNIAHFFV